MLLMIVGAVLIGITLGLMGSGGSILTVPVLVYVLGHDRDLAVAESMAIVGLIALVAAIPGVIAHKVAWKSVWFFGIPGMFGTFAGAWIGANYFSGTYKLILFSAVMFWAAWSMFQRRERMESSSEFKSPSLGLIRITKISAEGTVVGVITGIVGVGGGFLILPALVLWGGLSMTSAVATSLVIIVLKCLVGFAEYQYEFLRAGATVDWQAISVFFLFGATGSFVGRSIGLRIRQSTLRKTFSVLLVAMAFLILAREIASILQSSPARLHHGSITTKS